MDCTITCPCGHETVIEENDVPSGESLGSYAAWRGARHEENCGKTVSFTYGEPTAIEKKMGNTKSVMRTSSVRLK
jgi:hypothetical protein